MHDSRRGLLIISVDCGADERDRTWNTSRLADLCTSYRTPATWSLTEPGQGRLAPWILDNSLGHEVALAGDDAWVGSAMGRARFARELIRRLGLARSRGIGISTLALRGVSIGQHADLLHRSQIRVLRDGQVAASGTPSTARTLRHGVWQAPVSFYLPGSYGFWSVGTGLILARAVYRTAIQGGVMHVVVSASQVSEGHAKSLEQLLKTAQILHARGELDIRPLGALPTYHARSQSPSRSILRHAA